MALFELTLRDLADVMPWGQTLHWFGLTDGYYHLNVGEAQLFRYSEAILAHWGGQSGGLNRDEDATAAYPVVRLYEDILALLPDIIQPLPDIWHDLLSRPDAWADWRQQWAEFMDVAAAGDDAAWDVYVAGRDWARQHYLSSIHLNHAPDIWLWRHQDGLYIRWDNRHNLSDGIPVWATQCGLHSLPVADFIAEVEFFHARLMALMQDRIHTIRRERLFPHLQIDLNRLQAEHDERAGALAAAWQQSPLVQDWDTVLAANRQAGIAL